MSLSIPSNLIGNITYVCSVLTDGISLIWEIRGRQLSNNGLFQDAVREGIYIEPWPTDNTNVSTLSVSEQARQTYKALPIRCLASRGFKDYNETLVYHIITYGESSIW